MFQSRIEVKYFQHQCVRPVQGDILRDFPIANLDGTGQVVEILYNYAVLITQDCDLEQGNANPDNKTPPDGENNQFLTNVLILPAFPAAQLREGNHLQPIFKVRQRRISTDPWKIISQNNNERYHFLDSFVNYQIPDLVIDFKLYQTVETGVLLKHLKSCYIGTISELFRERLSQRFTQYLQRVALPELAS